MFITILQHIPIWVFGLLLGLIVLGLSQARPRQVGWRRAALLPLVMLLLSLAGVQTGFAGQPLALLGWAAALLATLATLHGRVELGAARYCRSSRSFELPGSWWPLVLMMSLFALKFVMGATLAMHPELRESAALALPVSAIYGVFSGVFVGRALPLWQLARQAAPARFA